MRVLGFGSSNEEISKTTVRCKWLRESSKPRLDPLAPLIVAPFPQKMAGAQFGVALKPARGTLKKDTPKYIMHSSCAIIYITAMC